MAAWKQIGNIYEPTMQVWELEDISPDTVMPWLPLTPMLSERTVICWGDFGGPVAWMGSALEADDAEAPVADFPLRDHHQTAIVFHDRGAAAVLGNALAIRPVPGPGVNRVTARVIALRRS